MFYSTVPHTVPGHLNKRLSVTDFGTMVCRYGPDSLALCEALARVRHAVKAIHATELDFDGFGERCESWWFRYGPEESDEWTEKKRRKFENGTRAVQLAVQLAALDRMASKVDAMTESESNRFNILSIMMRDEAEALYAAFPEFFDGSQDDNELFPTAIEFPLIYPGDFGQNVGGTSDGNGKEWTYSTDDLSASLTIHDTEGALVPRLMKCPKCKEWKTDVEVFGCMFKYDWGHGKGSDAATPICASCFGIKSCSTCGKSGCSCRFNECANEGCDHAMCACTHFDGWKYDDSGLAPGCAKYAPSAANDVDDDMYDVPRFCLECAPPGAVKDTGMSFR
jgi:hypothetical protein